MIHTFVVVCVEVTKIEETLWTFHENTLNLENKVNILIERVVCPSCTIVYMPKSCMGLV